MLGRKVPYKSTPFFWTRHYNKPMQYVGHCMGYDDIILHGSVSGHKFTAYYVKNDKIEAVSGMNTNKAIITMMEAFN